jgi:hypothetical protein
MNRDDYLKRWLDLESKKLDDKEKQTGVDVVTGIKKK